MAASCHDDYQATGAWRCELNAKKLRKIALVALMALSTALLTFGTGLAQGTTVDVTLGMSEFKFDPAELDVPLNTTVTFNVSNTGEFPHNVTFVAPDGTESNLFAESLMGGQSATGTFTFNTAGNWRMYCPVGQHEEQGMVGTVRVAAAAAGAAQATPAMQPTAAPTMEPAATSAGAAASPATLPTTGGNGTETLAMAAGALILGLALVLAGSRLRRIA